MGHAQRIPLDAIQEMKKILDALPDKNLGKTKEEALALLNVHILKAYTKGYSAKELAAILSKGRVTVSAPTLRAYTSSTTPKARKPPLQERPKIEPTKTVTPENAAWKQCDKITAKTSPGGFAIRPDTPLDEL